MDMYVCILFLGYKLKAVDVLYFRSKCIFTLTKVEFWHRNCLMCFNVQCMLMKWLEFPKFMAWKIGRSTYWNRKRSSAFSSMTECKKSKRMKNSKKFPSCKHHLCQSKRIELSSQKTGRNPIERLAWMFTSCLISSTSVRYLVSSTLGIFALHFFLAFRNERKKSQIDIIHSKSIISNIY